MMLQLNVQIPFIIIIIIYFLSTLNFWALIIMLSFWYRDNDMAIGQKLGDVSSCDWFSKWIRAFFLPTFCVIWDASHPLFY